MTIRELVSRADLIASFPLMKQLRSDLDLRNYLFSIFEMRSQGYRLFAIEEAGQFITLAGISILTNLYYGRHVWVYDLITLESHRSQGYGTQLLSFIEDLASKNGCQVVVLSSGVQRVHTHRFYEEKFGYARVSYVFKKNLR